VVHTRYTKKDKKKAGGGNQDRKKKKKRMWDNQRKCISKNIKKTHENGGMNREWREGQWGDTRTSYRKEQKKEGRRKRLARFGREEQKKVRKKKRVLGWGGPREGDGGEETGSRKESKNSQGTTVGSHRSQAGTLGQRRKLGNCPSKPGRRGRTARGK